MPSAAARNPPTPRRCHRMFEAHHLDCQGLSLRQIGRRLGRAPSTIHAYLKDFQLHRNHVLRTVFADLLADQLHILAHPETEPDQHRQTVAAIRELRLLLLSLPAIQEHNPQPRDDIGISDAAEQNQDPDEPGFNQTEPEQRSQNPEDFGPIETSLDKSEHPTEENSAPGKELAPTTPNSRPEPVRRPDSSRFSAPRPPPGPIGPQYPASWHNPFGYLAPQDTDTATIRRLFGNLRWQ